MSGFTFSSADLAILQNDSRLLQSNLNTPGAGAQTYKDILSDISQTGIVAYGHVPVYGPVPASGVDPAVWDWFNGAIAVNENSGFAGQFIVDYTVDQYNIRGEGNSYNATDFALASNRLALNVVNGILQSGSNTLPTLSDIGSNDAGQAAEYIFNPIYGANDASGWAGTLLFPFLGNSTYFSDLLLSKGTTTNDSSGLNKLTPGMYDFVVALESQEKATGQASINPLNWFSALGALFDPPYANVSGYQAALTADVTAANTAFANYYNLSENNKFMPGNDLVFTGTTSADATNTYVAGYATVSENIPTSGIMGQAIIIGGVGNNTITAPVSGNDLIDGGAGYLTDSSYNTLDLSSITDNLTIQSTHNLSGPDQILIEDSTREIYAYDFSHLILNAGQIDERWPALSEHRFALYKWKLCRVA